jgi:alkylation response protein AidB-like acyl-CoA dehydrogenase
MEFKEIYDTMMKPSRDGMSKAWAAGKNRLSAAIRVPDVPVQSEELRAHAQQLGRLIWRFNFAVNRALITYREPIVDMQLVQERIANAAMDLFASTCVLSRIDGEVQFAERNGDAESPDYSAADLFLRQSFRRIRSFLGGLTDNDDEAVIAAAKSCLTSWESGTTHTNGIQSLYATIH